MKDKITVCEIKKKKTLDGINGQDSVSTLKKKIGKRENTAIETVQNETQRGGD